MIKRSQMTDVKRQKASLWPIPVQLIGRMSLVLQAQGVSASAIFEGFPFTPEMLGKEITMLSYDQTLYLVRRGLSLARSPGLGLDVGSAEVISDLGVLGYAMSCCETLGEAIHLGVRYSRVAATIQSFLIADYPREETTRVIISLPKPLDDLHIFSAEEAASALCKFFSALIGKTIPIQEIHFSFPAPTYIERYEAIFNCPLIFSSACDQIVLHNTVLNTSITQANPLSIAMATQLCEQFLIKHPTESDLAMNIRQYLLEQNMHRVNEEHVAEFLCMSQRTLRRQLKLANQSFQGILDSVRAQLATEWLTMSPMKVTDIAERLGFSDASTFRRAFKQWTGHTPQQIRSQ